VWRAVVAVDALALRRGASDRAVERWFAVLDRERPDVDAKLGGNGSDWVDVSGNRVGKRHAFASASASMTVFVFRVHQAQVQRHVHVEAGEAPGPQEAFFCNGRNDVEIA
jgi:hypothetical protein